MPKDAKSFPIPKALRNAKRRELPPRDEAYFIIACSPKRQEGKGAEQAAATVAKSSAPGKSSTKNRGKGGCGKGKPKQWSWINKPRNLEAATTSNSSTQLVDIPALRHRDADVLPLRSIHHPHSHRSVSLHHPPGPDPLRAARTCVCVSKTFGFVFLWL